MRTPILFRPRFAAFLLLAPLGGCELFSSDSIVGDWDVYSDVNLDTGFGDGSTLGPDGVPIRGHGFGEDCLATDPCRPGLSCDDNSNTCVATGESAEGDLCTISAECGEGLACGLTLRCEPSAGLPENAQCASPADCGEGLRCNLLGFIGLCEPEGVVDAGGECVTSADCLSPLGCDPTKNTCQLPVFGGLQFMPDDECETVSEDTPFGVYFEIPREGRPLDDFFRLPFPNDIRAPGGDLDISDFPNPGPGYIGGDILGLYLDALERDFNGFSPNPTIYFRFRNSPDIESVAGGGDSPSLRFVNIDPDSPNFGNGISFYWTTTNGRRKFICPNFVAVRPAWSSPLEHNTTYAVILTDGVRGANGEIPTRDADLRAMLDDGAPSDAALRDAWDSYAPLREWLAEDEEGLDAVNVVGAAVFTTMDPDALMPALREAVRAQPTNGFENLTECEAGTISPCDDGTEERSCVSTSGQFVQIHGTYTAPIWQHGTRPYLTEEDGGGLELNGGVPVPDGTEQICVAMTIPTTAMPEGGWPVVMYGHGTGGSFTSAIREGVASALASAALPDARTAGFVTITIDGVQHGLRRGDTELDPEPLFYNFINPRSAQGNVQQGAADYFFLTHLLEQTSIDAAASPTGNEIRFDPANLYFFGHSQGAQVGASFVAFEKTVRAAVFSGSGGSLTLSLLNKTEPVDIAGAVSFVLSDGGRTAPADDRDVLLSLLQWHVDPVDPLNYARGYFRNIAPESTPQSILVSYGYRDSYSPEPNQKAFISASGVQLAEPTPGALDGLPTTTYPISGNRTVNGTAVTVAAIAVEPNDYDGHFVIFRDGRLNRQMREFFASAVLDGLPTITAP
jgi:hypothetical protein